MKTKALKMAAVATCCTMMAGVMNGNDVSINGIGLM